MMNQSEFYSGLNMNGHLILGKSELEILLIFSLIYILEIMKII